MDKMPKTITSKIVNSYSTGPTWVSDHAPQCISGIGMVALSWNSLEAQVEHMLSGILGRTYRGNDGGWAINPNWVISVAMSEVNTVRGRIKIVTSIFDRLLANHSLLKEWSKLSDTLIKRGKERNTVVHTVWGWSEAAPGVILQTLDVGKHMAWGPEDFAEVAARTQALNDDLQRFMIKVLTAIHDKEITAYVTPDMIMNEYM
jgi:hypothetical protein